MQEALITWALVNVVLPLAGIVAAGLLGRAALWANKKFKLDITQQAVVTGVNLAERIAENAIKKGLPKVSSNQKLNTAVEYVNKVIPGEDQEVIKKKIEAVVQQYRVNGNPNK